MIRPSTDVSLRDVSVNLDRASILSEITHEFPARRTCALLGASGSGKTTLLQVVNGLVKPSGGNVVVLDEPLPDEKSLPDLRLKIGYVIQQSGLFPHLSIFGNIALLGRIRNLADDHLAFRVQQLMDAVGLQARLGKKYPHELSGGEQQRAALCRALLLNPPILLMDEPFASLDVKTKQGIYGHLLAIQQHEPRTILLVTHDWQEAQLLADTFVWIEKGKIRQRGSRDQLEKAQQEFLESE
jgi:osmoprotectant transport system ATP-binding protein